MQRESRRASNEAPPAQNGKPPQFQDLPFSDVKEGSVRHACCKCNEANSLSRQISEDQPGVRKVARMAAYRRRPEANLPTAVRGVISRPTSRSRLSCSNLRLTSPARTPATIRLSFCARLRI